MAREVSAEPAVHVVESTGLAAGIGDEAAGFVTVFTVDTNDLMGEPTLICLSGYDALVRNKVRPYQ